MKKIKTIAIISALAVLMISCASKPRVVGSQAQTPNTTDDTSIVMDEDAL